MVGSKIVKECLHCKNQFDAPLAEHKRGNAVYCTQDCFKLSRQQINIVRNCIICSSEFKVTKVQRKDAKYCSKKCLHDSAKLRATKPCLYCGAVITFRLNYSRLQFCCISCSVRYRNERQNK